MPLHLGGVAGRRHRSTVTAQVDHPDDLQFVRLPAPRRRLLAVGSRRRRLSTLCASAALLGLLYALGAASALRTASSFLPTHQVVHMGFTLTVRGEELSTADIVMLALPIAAGGVGCGNGSNGPQEAGGIAASNFMNVSQDGSWASITMTPTVTVSNAVWCVKLSPGGTWTQAGSGTFSVTEPAVTSAMTSFGTSAYSYDLLTFTLIGHGLVRGSVRLSFLLSGQPCGGKSPKSDLPGGDATGLIAANAAGSSGSLLFRLALNASREETLRMCVSSNSGTYQEVSALNGLRIFRRAAVSFSPGTSINPSIERTFTITGENFAAADSTALKVKASSSKCEGASAVSDLPHGDEKTATFVSTMQATVSFSLGPILDSVSEVFVSAAGTGYTSGSIVALGGCSAADCGFAGVFGVSPLGEIDSAWISSPGTRFSSTPDLQAIYAGNVTCNRSTSASCLMSHSVTQIVQMGGKTSGCGIGQVVTAAAGADGSGFQAIVETTDDFGMILTLRIADHGAGYSKAPQLVMEQAGSCTCGTFIVDGLATQDSKTLVSVVGAFDPCFRAVVALSGVFGVSGGWTMRNFRLCARFGASSMWSQISAETITLNALNDESFTPTAVSSGQPFALTLIGTGFEADGPSQTKLKIASDCSLASDSDTMGNLPGGSGRPCDSISTITGTKQSCVVQFKLVVPGTTILAHVCRRVGGGAYFRATTSALSISGFQVLSATPSTFVSNAPAVVTITGVNLDQKLMHPTFLGALRVKVCPSYVCQGTLSKFANNGEPCAGVNDTRMCVSDGICVANVLCNATVDGGAFPGGSMVSAINVQNCNSNDYACTEAVFSWTLKSMANVEGAFYWMWDYQTYASLAVVPNSHFTIEGSWLTGLEQIPVSPVYSGSPVTLKISGRNLVNSGTGAVKLKLVNTPSCEGLGASLTDDARAHVGGNGRTLDSFAGSLSQAQGQIKFMVATAHRISPRSSVTVCWKIGSFNYREVELFDTATNTPTAATRVNDKASIEVLGTAVEGMTPSDYDISQGTSNLVGQRVLPMWESGTITQITITGQNFGNSAAESLLVIRPIAMPFSFSDDAVDCVKSNTDTPDGPPRDKACKEFKYTIDSYDGGASAYCQGGIELDSVHVEDYYPISIETFRLDGENFDRSRAVFNFSKVMVDDRVRFMVCWRMGRSDNLLFPWATIGHNDERVSNAGEAGVQAWNVWVTHTFGMNGAAIKAIAVTPEIVANRPFKLQVTTVGMGCNSTNPRFTLKLAIGNGLQAITGGLIGGGCSLGANSDSEGAVIGGEAVFPNCRPDLSAGLVHVMEADFKVVVQAATKLELCVSSTSGRRHFRSVFYVGGNQVVTLQSTAWYVESLLLNNEPLASASKLRAHEPFSLTLRGQGLTKTGPVKVQVSIAEDCEDSSTMLPGGDWRDVDCIFGHQNATVEFVLYGSVSRAQLCMRRTVSALTFVPVFTEPAKQRFYCDPQYCGAKQCFPSTNYLLVDTRCEAECCAKQCAEDEACNFWQRYEIPGRVYRRCETVAHCAEGSNTAILSPIDPLQRTPFVFQKTFGLATESYAAATLPDVQDPSVTFVTPQVSPVLRARIPFVVNVQGEGFYEEYSQIHVKVANTEIGCNDMAFLNQTLAVWNDIKAEREVVLAQIESNKNFSYNGTCAGGSSNCVGGPAPEGTICFVNLDCAPADGGECVPPNTGHTCLIDSHCTFGGFCNNSLYNLSITPPPTARELKIPFTEVGDAGALAGGQGKYVTVKNFSFAEVVFQIDDARTGVLCFATRNENAERRYLSQDGQINDLRLITAMTGYQQARFVEILPPMVSSVTPDHTFLFVETLFTLSGAGFYKTDRVKIVHPSLGCWREGMTAFDADTYGAVEGGQGVVMESVNAVGTQAKVRMRITEKLKSEIDDNQFFVCYQWGNETYAKVGDLFVANSPPIVTAYSPTVIYFAETSRIILQGMALGAAQKIKLIDAMQYTCSGESMNDKIRDEFAVAPGSLSSFLTLVDVGDYFEIDGDPFTNHAYLMQVEGFLTVSPNKSEDKLFTLCLKYGDLSLNGGTAGYLAIGNITAKSSQMTRVVTAEIYSGFRASFEIMGFGLLTQKKMSCKVVEKYHSCSGTSSFSGIVAGGADCQFLPFPNRSSTKAFADVTIPSGVATEANICARFDSAPWTFLGSLKVKRPSFFEVQLFDPSLKSALTHVVKGEAFAAKIERNGTSGGSDMIKVVSSQAVCGGTDDLADAVIGGTGTTIDSSGIATFVRGVDSGGQNIKTCIWIFGSMGYVEGGNTRWSVKEPFVSSFAPNMTILNLATRFSLRGSGLATEYQNSIIYISASGACSNSGSMHQLSSSENMQGKSATFVAKFHSTGQYAVCFGPAASLMQVGRLTVSALPTIFSVTPLVVFKNTQTSFLLNGVGLTQQSQLKLILPTEACTGNTHLPGANWKNMMLDGVSSDRTRAVTASFTLVDSGQCKLCYTPDDSLKDIIDISPHITIKERLEVTLLSPRVDTKTDIQRVEARMSNFVPACTSNWKSNYILWGPGGDVQRDSPAITDWATPAKCYARQSDVPHGYPTEYAPPGVNNRLVSSVKNMALEFLLLGDIGVGDKIFIARSTCGDNFTNPQQDPGTDFIPGGAPVTITHGMLRDLTGHKCWGARETASVSGPSLGPVMAITGAQMRAHGVNISFTMTRVTDAGQFHKLCIIPAGVATSMSIGNTDIKVLPPMLLAVEPTLVYSGMRMPFIFRGLGLLPGDKIKVVNGETFAACESLDESLDDASDIRGGKTVEFDADTSMTSSRAEFTLEMPSYHARICYKYKGSDVWGEMTNALSLTTSGYIYGYEGAMHFFYGETALPQTADNRVFGRNQTVLIIAPIPKFLVGDTFVARNPFQLTVEGDGLTEKARYIIIPLRVRCGGMPAGRRNVMKDNVVYSSVRLRTVIGGESRPPTVFSNDPEDSFEKMSQCTGSGIRDGCFAAKATSRNEVHYPVGISIKNIGTVRLCYLSDFGAEYQEVGQLKILQPYITNIFPRAAVVNIPFFITLTGVSLRSTDRIKVVDGLSCNGPLSSRPYTIPISVTDSPDMMTASAHLTVTGKVTSSSTRKVCYSYDRGRTYQDSGYSITVSSPQVHRVFPTEISIGGER